MPAKKQTEKKVTKAESGKGVKIETMDELLASTGYVLKGFRRGETVMGKVTEVGSRAVFVDVGGKMEAIVSESEYETNRDYLKSLKVGDEVTAYVVSPESDGGQMVLSLRRAASDARWKQFEEAMESGSDMFGMVKETNKGGLLVEIEGVVGFVPASQLSHQAAEGLDKMVGKKVGVKVVEVDRIVNRLVLSEKAVTDAGEIEQRRKLLELVKVGANYKGKIVGIVPFGVFVEVMVKNGPNETKLEGLVHISEISWEKIDSVSSSLKDGDTVDVQVIGTDEENGKLALSIKRLTDDPWKRVAAGYQIDSKHKGNVVKVAPYGVFVHLDKGIEGLIHASKMPADKSYKVGDNVDVFVESVDLEKRRLSLGVVLTAKPVGYK